MKTWETYYLRYLFNWTVLCSCIHWKTNFYLRFQTQMDTIAGDVLLSSAFLAYGGYFDQQMRSHVWSSWAHHMDQAEIKFRSDLARTEVRNIANGMESTYSSWMSNLFFHSYSILQIEQVCSDSSPSIQITPFISSTCRRQMNDFSGKQTPYQQTIFVLTMQSCWTDTIGTPSSSILQDKPQSSLCRSTKTRKSLRPGECIM